MNFLFPILLILISLTTGILLQRVPLKHKDPQIWKETLRKRLQRASFLYLNPLVLIGAVWILPLNNLDILFLPIMEILAIAAGGVYSIIYTRWRGMPRPIRGSHFCASYYTNVGSVGGLVVYSMLGEQGFVLLPLYKLLEPLMYFGVGFPLASLFGSEKKEKKQFLLMIIKDPVITISMSSICIGFLLNLSGIQRPGFYGPFNGLIIPVISAFLIISIGLGMDFSHMKGHIISTLSVAFIKFLLVPATITLAAYFLGLGEIMNGLPLLTVFILTSMPAGFVAIMPASLYGLDLDYANTAWILTMLSMIVIVPWIGFCLKFILPRLL